MTQVFQWLTVFDDRTLAEEVWVERMLAGVISYNEKFQTSLVAKTTVEEYLKWDAVVRSKERARTLWKTLRQTT